ncbi:MAG: glutathione S-transferase [Hyphomicrobiales bacterium]|nr:MAG: glutathione S-transferase [Hyphomicrobiales bacterium]
MSKPIEFYYWPTPNGWKISVMLEELGLPYELKLVHIGQDEQFEPAFLEVSPNNKIPAIRDFDGPGGAPVTVFESGAILIYLAEKTGKFYADDPRRRIQIHEWLCWQVGGLGPMAGQAHHFRHFAKEKIPYAIRRYTEEVERLYDVMDTRLEGRDWLVDDYSIADIACIGWINAHERQGQDLDEFPNLKAWYQRMLARPAVQRGLELNLKLRK